MNFSAADKTLTIIPFVKFYIILFLCFKVIRNCFENIKGKYKII